MAHDEAKILSKIEFYEKLFDNGRNADFGIPDEEVLLLAGRFAKIEEVFKQKSDISKYIPRRVAVLGNFSTQWLVMALKLYLYKIGIVPQIYEADYDGIVPEIMQESSGLNTFKPEILFILNDHNAIKEYPVILSNQETLNKWVERQVESIVGLWKTAHDKNGCQIFYSDFVTPVISPLGALSINLPSSAQALLNRINLKLAEIKPNYVCLIPMNETAANFGKDRWFDYQSYFQNKQGFSFEATAIVASLCARLAGASCGKIKKCLVLDLDNTLWGGVIGDDGLDGIILDPHDPVGEGYRFFQTYCKGLKERGILLAVCSKNNEEVAKEPFEKHSDMILKLSDISCFIANWQDKASNMKMIAEKLNIGIDSLVFADDNPAEREIIKKYIPEVAVVEMPEDPALYAYAVAKGGYFDQLFLTPEDIERSDSYAASAEREVLIASACDYNEYLKSLEMNASIKELAPGQIERFTQLINKSNQFNLRTRRYTAAEITAMLGDNEYKLIAGKLGDRFSQYGLISCVILKKAKNIAFIDTWLMSCRVLNRGMEKAVFNQIIASALELGCDRIYGEYIPSGRNSLVKSLLSDMGLKEDEEVGGYLLTGKFTEGTGEFYSAEIKERELFSHHIKIE